MKILGNPIIIGFEKEKDLNVPKEECQMEKSLWKRPPKPD